MIVVVDDPVFTIVVRGSQFELAFRGASLEEPGDSVPYRIQYGITKGRVTLKSQTPDKAP